MKIINGEAQDLTEKEFTTTALRDALFDRGDDRLVAARTALAQFSGKPSKQFVEWLSEGRLTKKDDAIVDVEENEEENEEQVKEPAATAS